MSPCRLTLAMLGAGARLDRIKVQEDAARAYHLANAHIDLGAEATLRDFTFTIGAAVTRNQGFVTFSGEGSDARVTGSYLLHDRQHCDTRLVIDHAVRAAPAARSSNASSTRRRAASSRARSSCAPMRRRPTASSRAMRCCSARRPSSMPPLEIFADDVICGHGATAGDLEEDHVFYLRSCGIPEDRARSMLITAFIAEAFDDVTDERLRDGLAARAEGWLDRAAPNRRRGGDGQ